MSNLNISDKNINIDNDYQSSHTLLNNNIFSYENENRDNECLICFEPIDNGEDVAILDCNHKFHFECIQKWVKNSSLNNSCCICEKNNEIINNIFFNNQKNKINNNNKNNNKNNNRKNNRNNNDYSEELKLIWCCNIL